MLRTNPVNSESEIDEKLNEFEDHMLHFAGRGPNRLDDARLMSRQSPQLFGFNSRNYACLTFRGKYREVIFEGASFFFGLTPQESQICGAERLPCLLAAELGCERTRRLISAALDFGQPIVLKNCSEWKESSIVRQLRQDEFWHPSAPKDDQNFPEVTLICKTADCTIKPHSRFQLEGFSFRDLKHFEKEMISIYERWVKDWHSRQAGKNSYFFRDFFDTLFEMTFSDRSVGITLGIWADNCFAGAFFADDATEEQIDIWGAVIDRERIKFGKALQALRFWAARRGTHFVNLGGSETESLHEFKVSLGKHYCNQRFIGVIE